MFHHYYTVFRKKEMHNNGQGISHYAFGIMNYALVLIHAETL